MNKARKLLAASAESLALPADVLAGIPRIEWIAGTELSVEPHNGLKEYAKEEILVNSAVGVIAICGGNMTVKLMNNRRIVIAGKIASVQLQEQDP